MIRCYITDRRLAGGEQRLLEAVARNVAAGADYIQVREKDLSARDLTALVRRVLAVRGAASTRILVNTRADVAIACGADGVHLPADCPMLHLGIPGFVTGVSCHSIAELKRAEREGASFAVFGPVFPPLSKRSHTEPTGIAGLREACAAVRLPVLALGGITWENAQACCEAGAAGIAGITLFQASNE